MTPLSIAYFFLLDCLFLVYNLITQLSVVISCGYCRAYGDDCFERWLVDLGFTVMEVRGFRRLRTFAQLSFESVPQIVLQLWILFVKENRSVGVTRDELLLSLFFASLHSFVEVFILWHESDAFKMGIVHFAAVCMNGMFGWVPFLHIFKDNISHIKHIETKREEYAQEIVNESCSKQLVEFDYDDLHYTICGKKYPLSYIFSRKAILQLQDAWVNNSKFEHRESDLPTVGIGRMGGDIDIGNIVELEYHALGRTKLKFRPSSVPSLIDEYVTWRQHQLDITELDIYDQLMAEACEHGAVNVARAILERVTNNSEHPAHREEEWRLFKEFMQRPSRNYRTQSDVSAMTEPTLGRLTNAAIKRPANVRYYSASTLGAQDSWQLVHNTFLHIAVNASALNIVRLLVNWKTDVQGTDPGRLLNGMSETSVKDSHYGKVGQIADRSMILEATNKDNMTPLLTALVSGRGAIAAELLRARAHTDARTPNNLSALDLAIQRKYPELPLFSQLQLNSLHLLYSDDVRTKLKADNEAQKTEDIHFESYQIIPDSVGNRRRKRNIQTEVRDGRDSLDDKTFILAGWPPKKDAGDRIWGDVNYMKSERGYPLYRCLAEFVKYRTSQDLGKMTSEGVRFGEVIEAIKKDRKGWLQVNPRDSKVEVWLPMSSRYQNKLFEKVTWRSKLQELLHQQAMGIRDFIREKFEGKKKKVDLADWIGTTFRIDGSYQEKNPQFKPGLEKSYGGEYGVILKVEDRNWPKYPGSSSEVNQMVATVNIGNGKGTVQLPLMALDVGPKLIQGQQVRVLRNEMFKKWYTQKHPDLAGQEGVLRSVPGGGSCLVQLGSSEHRIMDACLQPIGQESASPYSKFPKKCAPPASTTDYTPVGSWVVNITEDARQNLPEQIVESLPNRKPLLGKLRIRKDASCSLHGLFPGTPWDAFEATGDLEPEVYQCQFHGTNGRRQAPTKFFKMIAQLDPITFNLKGSLTIKVKDATTQRFHRKEIGFAASRSKGNPDSDPDAYKVVVNGAGDENVNNTYYFDGIGESGKPEWITSSKFRIWWPSPGLMEDRGFRGRAEGYWNICAPKVYPGKTQLGRLRDSLELYPQGKMYYFNSKGDKVPPKNGWLKVGPGTNDRRLIPDLTVRFEKEDVWHTLWQRDARRTSYATTEQLVNDDSTSGPEVIKLKRGMRVRSMTGRRRKGGVEAFTGSGPNRLVQVKFDDEMLAEAFEWSTWRDHLVPDTSSPKTSDSTRTQESPQDSSLKTNMDNASMKVQVPITLRPRAGNADATEPQL